MVVEPREVFLYATTRILDAMSKNRYGEAVKWLADLIYYASLKGMDDAYLKLLDKILMEVEGKEDRFLRGFVESLNRRLDGMKWGSEAPTVGELVEKAEKLKTYRLGKHLVPPETLRREAEKILREVGL